MPRPTELPLEEMRDFFAGLGLEECPCLMLLERAFAFREAPVVVHYSPTLVVHEPEGALTPSELPLRSLGLPGLVREERVLGRLLPFYRNLVKLT